MRPPRTPDGAGRKEMMLSGTQSRSVRTQKALILQALRIMVGEGLFEKAYGHVSARIPETELCCLLGHIHDQERTLDSVTEEDIIVIDMAGSVHEGVLEPPGEFPIHTEIYKRRPEIGSIVHCHPRAPIILSIAGQNVRPVSMRAVIFAPEVPTFADPTQIDSPDRGAALAEALGNARAIVLRGHGVVCTGGDVVEASVTALDLDEAAQLQLAASSIGEPLIIEDEHISKGVIRGLEGEFFTSAWHYFVAKYNVESGSQSA
jgi:L-fuculose-phosphate aldolase